MDAHVFRLLALEVEKFLHGGRVEKIHAPAAGLFTLTVFKNGLKRSLTLHHSRAYVHGLQSGQAARPLRQERHPPAIYLTAQKPPNPATPSGPVMTLRKYLIGRTLGSAIHDWPNRRVFFFVPQTRRDEPAGRFSGRPLWLCLDLLTGPSLQGETPETATPDWPDFGLLAPNPAESLQNAALWQAYPVLTPALRKTLSGLEPLEAAALLADLQDETENGRGELLLYNLAGAPHLLSAWPLSPAQAADLTPAALPPASPEAPFPGLEAARLVYEPRLLDWLGAGLQKDSRASQAAAEKRLEKTLRKLDQEESRLRELSGLHKKGLLLQGVLWRLEPAAKIARISLAAEETSDGRPCALDLDPLKTPAENLAHFFKQAARGARGLAKLKERRAALRDELERLRSGLILMPADPKPAQAARPGKQNRTAGPAAPSKLIQRFVSSDNIPLLRGRSALGNQALLKLAQPQDLWLHAQGGPSAHVIIRREHLGREIPERTLREAGILSAVKSWRKHDARAEIITALVKDVRPLKGGAPGSVLVDKIQRTFLVPVDHDLEKRLVDSLAMRDNDAAVEE